MILNANFLKVGIKLLRKIVHIIDTITNFSESHEKHCCIFQFRTLSEIDKLYIVTSRRGEDLSHMKSQLCTVVHATELTNLTHKRSRIREFLKKVSIAMSDV